MARFNINEHNENKYTKIEFDDGLEYISEYTGAKLYSDGLEFNEFMIYTGSHFEYEDGCYLGNYSDEIIARTGGSTSWIPLHKFYIEK